MNEIIPSKLSKSSESEKMGFVFDLDGTLLNNMGFFLRDYPSKVAQYYCSEFTPEMEAYVKSLMYSVFGGKGFRKKAPIIRAILKTAKLYGVPWYKKLNFLKVNNKIYHEGIVDMHLIPGVEAMLDELVTKHSVEIGICTTGSQKEVAQRMTNHPTFLDRFKGAVITRNMVEHAKPSPEGILMLSARWGIPPNRLVMIGDFSADVEAGKNAGTTTIGVLSGFCTPESMEATDPDFVFPDVSHIPANMERILKKIKAKQ